MRAAGLLFALRCTHSPFRGAAPVLARSTFVDPGAPGFGREGPWVRAPSQEGALSAETRSRDQVVVHLWSKIASAREKRISRSGIPSYFRRDNWSGREEVTGSSRRVNPAESAVRLLAATGVTEHPAPP